MSAQDVKAIKPQHIHNIFPRRHVRVSFISPGLSWWQSLTLSSQSHVFHDGRHLTMLSENIFYDLIL